MIAARGNGKSTQALELGLAMIRADVYIYPDHAKGELHVVSRNTKEPLTDEEKVIIMANDGKRLAKHGYRIVFDN